MNDLVPKWQSVEYVFSGLTLHTPVQEIIQKPKEEPKQEEPTQTENQVELPKILPNENPSQNVPENTIGSPETTPVLTYVGIGFVIFALVLFMVFGIKKLKTK